MTIRNMTLRATLLVLASIGVASAEPPQFVPFGMRADQIVERLTQPTGPGVSVTVSINGKVRYESVRGEANVELHVPTKVGDVYRIGSITKTVTAATVLFLAHQGKLKLTDTLAKFLPDFPGGSSITLAELLNHTAGVSDAWNVDPSVALDTRTLVNLIAKQPLDFAPGTAWRYSNSGYMLLGAVIEKVTGTSWSDAEKELVLAPFGMTHTDYYPDDVVVPDAVQGYSADASGKVTKPPFVSMAGPMTAGALSSTSGDIVRLAEGLDNAKLFPPALFKTMTTPVTLPDGSTTPYGDGLFLYTVRGEPAYGHNGGIEGFSSQFIVIPEHHVTVAVLVNSDSGTPSARAIALQLAAAAIAKPYTTFVDQKLTETDAQALPGSYQIQGDSVHVISREGGELYIQRAPGPRRRLVAAEGDILYYAGEGTDYIHVVRASDRRVSAIEFFTDGMAPARVEKRVTP